MDRLFGLDSVSAHDEGLELLTTVYDPAQLAVIAGVLESAQIPFLTKDRGAGGTMKILAGYSVFGTDIFVRKEQLELASAILDADFEGEEDADVSEEENDD